MPQTPEERNAAHFSVRLKAEEAERFQRILRKVQKQFPYVRRASVVRELIGLDKPYLVSKEDIKYFRTGE